MKGTNREIRMLMLKNGLTAYDVAKACKVSSFTFYNWMKYELPADKKQRIIDVIENYGQ